MDRREEDTVDEEISKGISRLDINQEPDSVDHDKTPGTQGTITARSNGNSNSLKVKFNQLVLDAKEKARQGVLEEALELFYKAYKIHKSEKLLKRINKLEQFIKEYAQEGEEEEEEDEDEDDDGMVEVGNGYTLAKEISEALYSYQKEGVLWFWKLFQKKQGGILGDDMGLGKTIQVIAFLSGMFDNELIKSVLIVMPVSLIANWQKEFETWTPGIRVKCFHGSNKKERQKNLDNIQHKNGVCLTTYGLVISSHEILSHTADGRQFKWDYVILDEGHKIKNPTKTNKNIRSIPARNRFILTGTPVQNNLREMWSLLDYVTQGQLLGSSRTFKQEFENPIVRARERDASAYDKRIGNEMAKSLRNLIDPHFLRRTKAMVLKPKDSTPDKEDGNDSRRESTLLKTPGSRVPDKLTRKNDLIIWLHLSDTQLKIYSDFLGLEHIKEILMSTRSPLAELNVLKKICDHPRLLSAMACSQLGLDDNARLIEGNKENNENSKFLQDKSHAPRHTDSELAISDNVLIQESGKVMFLAILLDNLKEEQHRCLVFSQSRKMLDIIQRVITHRGHKVIRIDGTITKTADRQHLITTFQTNPSYTCCLLTTQVGGVGLTLTGADRVVIFDPSWNPATDAQAVDRAYRIGQKKPVVIYRLITCGTIEEKIYRKQIFKDALMKQTTGSSMNPFRYFTREDLRELFTLDDPMKSKTQVQLAKMHAQHRDTDEELDRHIDFLHSLKIFGITDHDLMFSQEAVETVEEMEETTYNDAIQARVLRAQNMVAAESNAGGVTLPSSLPAPYQNPKSLLKPIDLQDLVNQEDRKTIQAKIHQFEVFKPTREDTKRFQPRDKKPQIPPILKPDDVIDLCTPPDSPSKQTTHGDDTKGIVDLTMSHQNTIDDEMANLSITNQEKDSPSFEIEKYDSSDDCHGDNDVILDSSPPKELQHSTNDLIAQAARDSPMQTRDSPIQTLYSPIQTHDSPIQTRDSPIQTRDSPIQTRDSPIQTRDSPIQTSMTSPGLVESEEEADGEQSHRPADGSEDEMSQSELQQRLSFSEKVNDSLSPRFSDQPESWTEKNTQENEESDLRPSTPLDDTDLPPNTPVDDTDITPNTPVDDTDITPNTPVDDTDLPPNTPVDDTDLPPNTPVDDTDLPPNTPVDDTDLPPNTPVDDTDLPPSTPADHSIENILFASPAVYIPEDGKRQTPRRKSSNFRRKSMSQRVFNNVVDSDDDDEEKSKDFSSASEQQAEQMENSSQSLYEDAMDYLTPNGTPSVEPSVFSSANSDKSCSLDEEDVNHSFRRRLSSTVMEYQNSGDEDEDDVNIKKVQRKVKRIESSDDQEENVDSGSNSGSSTDEQNGKETKNLEDDNSNTANSRSSRESDNDDSEDEITMKTKTPRKILRIESDEEEEEPENEEVVGSASEEDLSNESKEDESEESEARSSSDVSAESSRDQEDEENPEYKDGAGSDSEDDLSNGSKENKSEDSEARSSSDVSAESSQNQEESHSSLEEESDEERKKIQKKRVQRLESSDDEHDEHDDNDSESSKDRYDCSKDVKMLLNNLGNQTASNSEGRCTPQKKYCCPSGLHESSVIKIEKCPCVLDDSEKQAYSRNIRLAKELESFGRHDVALDSYLEALKIDSSDLRIHKKALELAKLLNLV